MQSTETSLRGTPGAGGDSGAGGGGAGSGGAGSRGITARDTGAGGLADEGTERGAAALLIVLTAALVAGGRSLIARAR